MSWQNCIGKAAISLLKATKCSPAILKLPSRRNLSSLPLSISHMNKSEQAAHFHQASKDLKPRKRIRCIFGIFLLKASKNRLSKIISSVFFPAQSTSYNSAICPHFPLISLSIFFLKKCFYKDSDIKFGQINNLIYLGLAISNTFRVTCNENHNVSR